MTTTKSQSTKARGFWRGTLTVLLVSLTLIAAIGTLAGAYGGDFSPSRYRGLCLMILTFPAWATLLIIMTILDALWCRKALVISLVTFIAAATALWDFSPLNITRPSLEKYKDCPKFTLMSYNVCNFLDQDTIYPGGMNPTLSLILRADPDIVCLQEAASLSSTKSYIKIHPSQIDSLHRRYPYILTNGLTQMILSKYPAEVIPTGYSAATKAKKRPNEIAVFRVTVDGVDITIFNVHLEAYHLRKDDKELYRELTDLHKNEASIKESIFDIKSQLLSKIQTAAEFRELDAERLISYITRLGGPNVIVTGDFNDVPGCYTLRRLADCDLHQVYPEVGFGPMITFNANRFYFRIDHTLYRGCMHPLRMSRPSQRSSDHYPLITLFALTAPE